MRAEVRDQYLLCADICPPWYQMNYGFTKDGVAEPTRPDEPKPEEEEEPKAKKAKVAEPAKAKWFEEDEAKTTKVSRGFFQL